MAARGGECPRTEAPARAAAASAPAVGPSGPGPGRGLGRGLHLGRGAPGRLPPRTADLHSQLGPLDVTRLSGPSPFVVVQSGTERGGSLLSFDLRMPFLWTTVTLGESSSRPGPSRDPDLWATCMVRSSGCHAPRIRSRRCSRRRPWRNSRSPGNARAHATLQRGSRPKPSRRGLDVIPPCRSHPRAGSFPADQARSPPCPCPASSPHWFARCVAHIGSVRGVLCTFFA